MKHNEQSGDVLKALAQTGVAKVVQSCFADTVKAEGVYHFSCMGVVNESDRTLRATLLAEMALIEMQPYAARDNVRLDFLQAELDAIPMEEKWNDEVHNVVMNVGRQDMLDKYIQGSGFTQVGPYMGLISSVSWSAVSATGADTMASHAGWTEAGSTNAPTFSARIAPSWSAATAGSPGATKTVSAAVSFTMTGAGTLEGAFIALGTGAVVTLMSTAGILFSAGAFTGGAKVVASTDVVNVTYSVSV